MTERRPVSSSETPLPKKVSPAEMVSLKKAELIEKIYSRAIEVKNDLITHKIKPDGVISVVLSQWPDDVVETKGCWIITNRHSMHHKLGKLGVQYSSPYEFTTGYALKETGEIIEYETDEDIKKNPRLFHVPGKQLGEIITENPLDPEEYIDNGIMRGLNELSERAKIATNK